MLADFPFADSLNCANSVAAPGAGAVFSSSITPPAGIYRIMFWWCLTGTAETVLNNVRLKANALNIVTTLPSLTGAGWMSGVLERVQLDGVNALSLAAGAAAAAGSQYSGLVVATRVG